MSYEYKVVPAPVRGLKAKGLKTGEDRFANALQTAMNDQAADGWDYLRADTLPSEQREGLMGKTTVYQNMLVFRRVKSATASKRPEPAIAAPVKAIVDETDNTALMLDKPDVEEAAPKPDKKSDVAAQ